VHGSCKKNSLNLVHVIACIIGISKNEYLIQLLKLLLVYDYCCMLAEVFLIDGVVQSYWYLFHSCWYIAICALQLMYTLILM
jgi:hypothetical protein